MTRRFVDPDLDTPEKKLAREIEAREEALKGTHLPTEGRQLLMEELRQLRHQQGVAERMRRMGLRS